MVQNLDFLLAYLPPEGRGGAKTSQPASQPAVGGGTGRSEGSDPPPQKKSIKKTFRKKVLFWGRYDLFSDFVLSLSLSKNWGFPRIRRSKGRRSHDQRRHLFANMKGGDPKDRPLSLGTISSEPKGLPMTYSLWASDSMDP